jgi:hypothetical protein
MISFLMVLIRVTNKDFFRLHRLLPQFYSVPNFKQAHVRQYQTGIIFESDPAEPKKRNPKKTETPLNMGESPWEIGKITINIKAKNNDTYNLVGFAQSG